MYNIVMEYSHKDELEMLMDAWKRNHTGIDIVEWDDEGIDCQDRYYNEQYFLTWEQVRKDLL